jgi:hypothetical protein
MNTRACAALSQRGECLTARQTRTFTPLRELLAKRPLCINIEGFYSSRIRLCSENACIFVQMERDQPSQNVIRCGTSSTNRTIALAASILTMRVTALASDCSLKRSASCVSSAKDAGGTRPHELPRFGCEKLNTSKY